VRCIADYCAAAAAAQHHDDVSVAVETDAAVCQTLDAYSELCVARHSAFSWRTTQLCRMSSNIIIIIIIIIIIGVMSPTTLLSPNNQSIY